jgi:hypothetical protein
VNFLLTRNNFTAEILNLRPMLESSDTTPSSVVLSHDEKFVYISKNPSKLIHGFWVNLLFPNGLYKINKNSGGMEREPCN